MSSRGGCHVDSLCSEQTGILKYWFLLRGRKAVELRQKLLEQG